MKLPYRNLLLGIIITGSILTFSSSCKKEFQKNTNDSPKKYSLMSGTIRVDQSWVDLRNKARNEFDFYFRDYAHTRDFLKEVDWSRAILNEYNGQKVMVFLFKTDAVIKADARLMVIQDRDGSNRYNVRIKSKDINGYASIYNANDKTLTIGTIRNETFEPIGQTKLKGTGVLGGSICYSCHHPEEGGDDWGDPDGPGGIDENNWLDDVIITDRPIDWSWVDDIGWNGGVVVIPDNNPNIDNDPCNTFQNQMNNPAFRDKLQELIANTTLNHETAFSYNGTTFSPWYHGPAGGNYVQNTIPPDGIVQGHSHYSGIPHFGTFSPEDLYTLYQASQGVNNPMGFAMVVATPGDGVSMIKIINHDQFNSFANTWLVNGNWVVLEGYYNNPPYNVGTGPGAAARLQTLLDAFQSGLRVQHISNPNQGSESNPCQ